MALLVLLLVLLGGQPGAAVDFRGGETIHITAEEVVDDDLYAAGQTIVVDGTIRGDLVAVAREVRVTGTIEGDLISCAQVLILGGTIGDDARIAGQVLKLDGEVGDDLVAAGMGLETGPRSQTRGSLVFSGAQALLAGTVSENAQITSQGLELRGVVHGDVVAELGDGTMPGVGFGPFQPSEPLPSMKAGLTLRDNAEIGGRLEYQAPQPGGISENAQVAGATEHTPVVSAGEQAATTAQVIWKFVRRWISLILVGLLVLWLAPRWFRGSAGRLESKPLRSLAWGVATPIVLAVSILLVLVVAILAAVLLGRAAVGQPGATGHRSWPAGGRGTPVRFDRRDRVLGAGSSSLLGWSDGPRQAREGHEKGLLGTRSRGDLAGDSAADPLLRPIRRPGRGAVRFGLDGGLAAR